MSKEIFISHSHKDKKIAAALTDCIVEAIGLEYRDILCTSHSNPDVQLKPGDDINRKLRKYLDNCRILIPIISRDSIERNFVLFEIGGAWVLKKKIMPVLLEKKMQKTMPDVISGLIFTEFDKKKRIQALMIALAQNIFHASDQPTKKEINSAVKNYLSKVKDI